MHKEDIARKAFAAALMERLADHRTPPECVEPCAARYVLVMQNLTSEEILLCYEAMRKALL